MRTSVVTASRAISLAGAQANPNAKFDCFYIYPTVSTETSTNADLRVQPAEVAAAVAQASRFSELCRVWAPMYHQVTLAGLETPGLGASSPEMVTAYQSLLAGFSDYLARYNDGRPIVLIGHSQGAAIAIELLEHLVDNDAALRSRLVVAIVLGGNVVVPTGKLEGGSFSHIPLCSSTGETGCVIAYSSFPGEPPAGSLFGRPGQGVSVMSGQTATAGLQVACVNPAALSGGAADLEPLFPTDGAMSTPWVEFPGLYRAQCKSGGGATWLQVTKLTGASDHRPVVTETEGPDWGYHVADVNLALGNLLADTAAAEATWSRHTR
jgi:pimeloyl-ACP methyl ester carboxylesterase